MGNRFGLLADLLHAHVLSPKTWLRLIFRSKTRAFGAGASTQLHGGATPAGTSHQIEKSGLVTYRPGAAAGLQRRLLAAQTNWFRRRSRATSRRYGPSDEELEDVEGTRLLYLTASHWPISSPMRLSSEHVVTNHDAYAGPTLGGQFTVLVVDDEESVQRFLRTVLEREGYGVAVASDGAGALEAIALNTPDVVILDLVLPVVDGYEVCRRVRADARTRLLPVVMVTGHDAHAERVAGLKAGADDFLGKPLNTAELLARVQSLARIKRYTDDLDPASSILTTLATMIEARYGYSPGHCHRMANYATAIGRSLNISDADMQALYRGAFLHDIGMLAVSDAVLQRPGGLTPEEYEAVKAHTTVGDALCANLRSLQSVRPIIRWHHERLDGSGYPDGLAGNDIPLVVQIVSVVEVYEAVTVPRPYQSPMTPSDAIALLRRHAARGWLSSAVVDALAVLLQSMVG